MGKKNYMIKKILARHVFNKGGNKKIIYSLIFSLVFLSFMLLAPLANASVEIFFKSYSENIYKGDSFIVDLKISSSKKSINTVDGTIIYDKNKIEVKNLSVEESLLSIWPKSPVFYNDKGQIDFIGGIPGGFKGANGQILRITFLAKKSGKTQIDFQDIFSVFLNDGLGTNINPYLVPASITIINKPVKIILQDFWENLGVKKEKDNNLNSVILSLFIIVIIVIIYIRLKKNKFKKN